LCQQHPNAASQPARSAKKHLNAKNAMETEQLLCRNPYHSTEMQWRFAPNTDAFAFFA
jgi:hypothetical protein